MAKLNLLAVLVAGLTLSFPAMATLDDLLGYLRAEGGMEHNLAAVQSYRDRYGVA